MRHRTRPETHQNLIYPDKEQQQPRPGLTWAEVTAKRHASLENARQYRTLGFTATTKHRSNRPAHHRHPKRGGGGERVRTDDPLLAKQVLSQLSYTPNKSWLVGQGGFEPPTPRLSSVCSNQLSY